MNRGIIFSISLFALMLGSAAIPSVAAARKAPVPAAPAADAAKETKIPVDQYTLKNGLRVVLSEDHAAPTVSLCVTYDVGSRNEQPGHTGFAHLFEHIDR